MLPQGAGVKNKKAVPGRLLMFKIPKDDPFRLCLPWNHGQQAKLLELKNLLVFQEVC